MNINCAWAENYYVVKANLLHERVHGSNNRYSSKGKRVLTAVSVYNDDPAYSIYGVVDCIELIPSAYGVAIEKNGQPYRLCIVEYKPTMPKDKSFSIDDALQVFAQKICVDACFGCNCECELYYADTKKRISLPFREEYAQYDEKLRSTLQQMRGYADESKIPPIMKGQNCQGCSMKDMCMPVKSSRIKAVSQQIKECLEEPCENY